jgi:hypothetical protein
MGILQIMHKPTGLRFCQIRRITQIVQIMHTVRAANCTKVLSGGGVDSGSGFWAEGSAHASPGQVRDERSLGVAMDDWPCPEGRDNEKTVQARARRFRIGRGMKRSGRSEAY